MRIALLAALVALGCSSDKRSQSAPHPGPPPANGEREGNRKGISSTDSAPTGPIPIGSQQLVVAVVDDWDAVPAQLQRYEREGGGKWRKVGDAWDSVIGVRGSGWGVGLHGAGAPDGRDGPVKVEGDGKSPAGAFAIGSAYGYADSAPEGARLHYQPVDGDWRCVDDPGSAHYNQVFDRRDVDRDWKSAERMRRSDDLYRWVIHVDHNPEAQPGAGSCIFLHVWGGKSRGSAGCTAMAEDRARGLLTWLDPAKKPVFVLLPRAVYRDLASPWQLPPAP